MEALEDQIKKLNEKFDNMTIVDSSITLASAIGSLSVKEKKLKSTQDELEETKKILEDKVRIMTEVATKNENLKRQFESGKHALRDTKSLLWDHMLIDSVGFMLITE